MNEEHRYKPLKANSHEFRIIDLHAGTYDDPISCESRIVTLDNNPEYCALSYVWGEPGLTETITLDGKPFQVRNNLGIALRYVRKEAESRTFWIDLLSINQHDQDEKSWQVNMMSEIYSSCESVIIWLGKDFEDSDSWCSNKSYGTCLTESSKTDDSTCEPVSYFIRNRYTFPDRLMISAPFSHGYGEYEYDHNLYHLALEGEPPYPGNEKTCRWHGRKPEISKAFDLIQELAKDQHLREISGLCHLQGDNRFGDSIQALLALLRRPWWQRIWTVQEAVLPKDGIVMCGSLTISWATVVQAAKNWHIHADNCCSHMRDRIYRFMCFPTHGEPTYMSLSTFHRAVLALDERRPKIDELPTDKLPNQANFVRLFQKFSNRLSSDPRDKVYGLLGVLAEEDRPIRADYGAQMNDINLQLSRKLLLSGNFSVLYDNPLHHDYLPTWAKDFGVIPSRVDQIIQELRDDNREDYRASGPKKAMVSDCDGQSISITAALIETVATVSRNFLPSESLESMATFLRECGDLSAKLCHRESPCVGQYRDRDDFLRSTLGNRYRPAGNRGERIEPSQEVLASMRDWIWYSTAMEEPRGAMVGSCIKYNICNRAFFTTTQGRIGFGPADACPGDELWIPYGSKVPFVLRRLDGAASEISQNLRSKIAAESSKYFHRTVVGDCYIQGIMNGEAIVEQTDGLVVTLH
ncbi:hypothetical protein BU24DRAFT_174169 [Aaosphaeria arxii CBS 175.79]|uniref:Heterokaryon incompatibility domain-containing protein n=1 Tax=Aaosphaeria arxii CBS 175.79 TaxID=1450172 RepID=A0A6A5XQQ8_9PLEO|nr:uncharacterized protein BU24DRAFT_174169 [Aaosphaeria arxii CBS 175.79]KAF2015229.1 hypothetical protein BU24DRAFT_174169 [Aaosphaeria arxii CBS 175.79]